MDNLCASSENKRIIVMFNKLKKHEGIKDKTVSYKKEGLLLPINYPTTGMCLPYLFFVKLH